MWNELFAKSSQNLRGKADPADAAIWVLNRLHRFRC